MDEAIAARLRDADLVLAIGGRLGDVTTRGYTLLEVPRPRQTLVHVHPDPGELGRVYETDLAIVAALPELAAALRALIRWSRAGASGRERRAPTTWRTSSTSRWRARSTSAR